MRVEVGYGLEGTLPDGKVGAILDTYVIPKFKAGDFDQGLIDGVDALVRVARAEPIALVSAKSESYDPSPWGIGTVLAGIGGTIAAAIGSITGFRRWRRYRRRRCPRCQTLMTRLGEVEDDALLAEGQQAEERVGSVDYDVWKCGECSHHFTLRYPKWMTGYAKCPQCGNRTKSSTETVIAAATTSSSGSAQSRGAVRVLQLPSRVHEDASTHPAELVIWSDRRAAVRASAAAARAAAAPVEGIRCAAFECTAGDGLFVSQRWVICVAARTRPRDHRSATPPARRGHPR